MKCDSFSPLTFACSILSTLVAVAMLATHSAAASGVSSAPALTIHRLQSNDPDALMSTILQAYRSGRGQVVIPPGVYKLAKPQGKYYLSFSNMKHFQIIGNGVTLLRTDPTKGGIQFEHCRGVTLEGFTLRCDPLPYTQGRIIAVTNTGVTSRIVRLCRGYPSDIAKYPMVTIFSAKARRIWPGATPVTSSQIKSVGPRTFLLKPFYVPCKTGDWAVFRHPGGPCDVRCMDCHHMCISHVTVMGGTGFCFYEQGGKGANRYFDDSIVYPPVPKGATRKPILACNLDGLHSNSVRRGPIITGCHFEGTGDDSLAIQGWYAVLEKCKGRKWVVQLPASPGSDFCRIGDKLRLINPRGGYLGSTQVVGRTQLRNFAPPGMPKSSIIGLAFRKHLYYSVTVGRPVAAAAAGDRINDIEVDGAGFVIRHCTIEHGYSRGMIIKADDGIIEDNTVDACANGDIEITPELHWDESGSSCNLLIEGNVIRNTGFVYPAQPSWPEAGALSIMADTGAHAVNFNHDNLSVINNRFIGNNGINLLISDARNMLIVGNTFVRPMCMEDNRGANFHFGTSSLIWLQQCKNILLACNHVIDPGPAMKKLVALGPNVTNVKGLADGVKIWAAR